MIPKPIKPKENKLGEQVERAHPFLTTVGGKYFRSSVKDEKEFYVQL